MKIDQTKLERQRKCIYNWRLNKGLGGVQAVTGFGKTFMTLMECIVPLNKARPNSKTIVIVHTVDLKNQWQDKINTIIPDYKNTITVLTIQSLVSQGLFYNCDLLVLDEVDEYFGNQRKSAWDGKLINFKWLLWLSATPKDRQKRDIEFLKKYPCVDTITREEAQNNNWVSKYEIYNLGIDLTEEERFEYEFASEAITKYLSKFNNNLEYANRCLAGYKNEEGKEFTPFICCKIWARHLGWSESLNDIVNGKIKTSNSVKTKAQEIISQWSPNHIMGYAKELFKFIRIRKNIIQKAENKAQAFVDIANYLPKSKIVGFGQSTVFANIITNLLVKNNIKAVAYHSNLESTPLRMDELGNPSLFGTGDWIRYKTKTSKKYKQVKLFGKTVLKRLTLKAIISGKIRAIITASAVDKGLSVDDINLGIITSFIGNPNQFIQRLGRTIRINPNNKNKLATVVCIYAKDTKEEYKLQKVQNTEEVYWINDVKDIGNKKNSKINYNELGL